MQATSGKFVAVLVLLLAVLAVAVSLSFATKGFVYDQVYAHDHSEAYADNGKDFSRLQSCCLRPDNIAQVIDQSCNGYDARERVWDEGRLIAVVRDGNGCVFGAGFAELDANADRHDTCIGKRDGSLFGCGPDSLHGT